MGLSALNPMRLFRRILLFLWPKPSVAAALSEDYAVVAAWFIMNEPLWRILRARWVLNAMPKEHKNQFAGEAMLRVSENRKRREKSQARKTRKKNRG
jgi:hypothetical protein